MTDQEINIAIAESAGWVWIAPGNVGGNIPDYCHSLDAIMEAARWASHNLMNADQWEQFGQLLYRAHPTAVISQPGEEPIDFFDLASLITELSARQISEAFLRALNKWREPSVNTAKTTDPIWDSRNSEEPAT